MDELADSREDGSGRVPDQEPAARSAERDVAAAICAKAPRSSAGTSGIRPATRRPGRSRPAWASRSARGAAAAAAVAGALRDRLGRQRRRARRHAGPRHRHAHARRDGRRRNARPASRRRSSRRSATRCTAISGGSGGSTTAASISPAIRIAAVKALDALNEKVAPALGVEAGALVAASGRIQVKDTPSKGLSWADACKQIGPQPISVDGDWQPGLSSVTTSRRAVRRGRPSTSRPASSR